MRTTNQRRNRLRSATGAQERWRPPRTFVVLAVGLLIGLALGISNRASNRSASVQQHYLLLVSDLYAQGVPLANVRDRLLAVGYANPVVAVLSTADQLARLPDSLSQQEADQLHQFAKALAAGPKSPTTVVTQPVSQTGAGPTPTVLSPTPAEASVAVAVVVPTSAATPVPSESPVPTITAETTSPTTVPRVVAPPLPPTATPAPPTPRPPPEATAASAKLGVVHTTGGKPAVLRAGAWTKTTAVAVVPDGAKIEVYGSMDGEALNPPDATWYHVVYNGKQGYLYSKQLKLEG